MCKLIEEPSTPTNPVCPSITTSTRYVKTAAMERANAPLIAILAQENV